MGTDSLSRAPKPAPKPSPKPSPKPPPPPLPVRDGVSPSFVWLPDGAWPNLLAFLAHRFPNVAAEAWMERMARGELVAADGTPQTPASPYRKGACLFYYRAPPPETPIPFEETVIYQDQHIVVADKPHFLPVIPSGRFLHETLLVRLKRRLGLDDLVPVHRLDRETAGVVLFSHNPASRGAYQTLFRERAVEKVYEAVAAAPPGLTFPLSRKSRMVEGGKFFVMREGEGEPNSETRFALLERRGPHVLVEARPVTGKQHQIRLHMAALGMPILNDAFYPLALPCKGDDFSSPLQLLARSLAFADPFTGEMRRFTSARRLGLFGAAG